MTTKPVGGPKRIQRKRTKGWKMPPNTVYVGRPTVWGNPWRKGPNMDAKTAVSFYRELIKNNIWSAPNEGMIQGELRGKNLCCWCPPDQPCHADVLLEIANAE